MNGEKPIVLNKFSMDSVSHLNYGLWPHPRDQTYRYNATEYWTELAQLLDRGRGRVRQRPAASAPLRDRHVRHDHPAARYRDALQARRVGAVVG